MKNTEIHKNVLDLKYQSEIQKLNAILIVISVGILSFLGTFIWYRERLIFGITISLIILIMGIWFYRKTKDNMDKILREIQELAT